MKVKFWSYRRSLFIIILLISFSAITGCSTKTSETNNASSKNSPVILLNVSYDPTRELYQEYNAVFAEYWKEKTGQEVTVQQSHGGRATDIKQVPRNTI